MDEPELKRLILMFADAMDGIEVPPAKMAYTACAFAAILINTDISPENQPLMRKTCKAVIDMEFPS